MTNASLYHAVQPEGAKAKQEESITEEALARRQYDLFTKAYDGHRVWVRKAQSYDQFYVGEQWRQADLDKLKNEGRPALTINMILSTVNVALGEQITNRLDIQYKSRKKLADETAFAATKLAMSILEESGYKWLESTMFSDGLIQDRGYLDIRMDWSESIEGRPKIRTLNPLNVIPDSGAQDFDPDSWNEVWYTEWVSLDHVATTYGDEMANKLQAVADQGPTYGIDSIVVDEPRFSADKDTRDGAEKDELTKRTVRSVRLIERQYRVGVRIHYLVDPTTGQRRPLPVGTTLSEAQAISKQYQVFLQSATEQRIKWCVTCDRFVLHESWSPYKTFTIIPFFPYFRRGKPFGMVANLISPQEQYNKLASQELHVVNSTANSGWIVEQGALIGKTADELAADGSKNGLVLEVAPGKLTAIQKIQPNTVPTGLTHIAQNSKDNINIISGVNAGMAGTQSAEVSGVALEKTIGVGQVQLSVVKDNLARTQFFVARKLLDLMKNFMGYTQVINFTRDDDPTQQPSQDQVVVNEPQADGSVKNDITVGDFDIIVASMPDRVTFNEIQFAEALSLRAAGVPIPAYRVVLYSNMEDKYAIAEELKSLEGLAPPTPEQVQKNQVMEQLALADAQAEIAAKEAKAAQSNTQAELNQAKTQTEMLEPQMRNENANREWAEASRGHKTRIDLELIKSMTKLDTEQIKQANKPASKDN